MSVQLSPIEKEIANFDFAALEAKKDAAKANIKSAASASDVIAEICKIWKSIKPYVKILEAVPFVGKFITILAELLDTLCPA